MRARREEERAAERGEQLRRMRLQRTRTSFWQVADGGASKHAVYMTRVSLS